MPCRGKIEAECAITSGNQSEKLPGPALYVVLRIDRGQNIAELSHVASSLGLEASLG